MKKNKYILISCFSAILIISLIIFLFYNYINNTNILSPNSKKNEKVNYTTMDDFMIDKNGMVSINPSYVNLDMLKQSSIKEYQNVNRLPVSTIKNIYSKAEKLNLSPLEYMFLCYSKEKKYDDVFKTFEDADVYLKILKRDSILSFETLYNDNIAVNPCWEKCATIALTSDSSNKCPEKIVIPENINGIKVTGIATYGFAGCSMNEIIMPNTIETVSSFSFQSCKNLKYLTLSDNLKTIKSAAFIDVYLNVKDVKENINWNNVIIEDNNEMIESYLIAKENILNDKRIVEKDVLSDDV